MEVPHKIKSRVAIGSSNLTPGHMSRENYNLKRYMHPTFTAALVTIAKTQKQPKGPPTDERKRRCGTYIQRNTTQP